MDHLVGIDVTLDYSSDFVVTQSGTVVREDKVACDPEALITFLCEKNLNLTGIGLEAGSASAGDALDRLRHCVGNRLGLAHFFPLRPLEGLDKPGADNEHPIAGEGGGRAWSWLRSRTS